MKLAIATAGSQVAAHFGRCDGFTVFTVMDRNVAEEQFVPSPEHQPGLLPAMLANLGVNCVVAGGMGPKAQSLFSSHGIQVITGVEGTVQAAATSFAAGDLVGDGSTCSHGEGHCEH